MTQHALGSRCLLITGPGHTGTRLLLQMLGRHPDISVPTAILNEVSEFTPLHQFFIGVNARMPLYADRYDLDLRELAFILEAYRGHCAPAKPYYVLKMPHYPLCCLDEICAILNPAAILYADRPTDKILASYISRGEDKSLFGDPVESIRQLKKCPAADRQALLGCTDIRRVVACQIEGNRQSVRAWNQHHPDRPVIDVAVERVARDGDYHREIMGRAGIETTDDQLRVMRQVIDVKRLMQGEDQDTSPSGNTGCRETVSRTPVLNR